MNVNTGAANNLPTRPASAPSLAARATVPGQPPAAPGPQRAYSHLRACMSIRRAPPAVPDEPGSATFQGLWLPQRGRSGAAASRRSATAVGPRRLIHTCAHECKYWGRQQSPGEASVGASRGRRGHRLPPTAGGTWAAEGLFTPERINVHKESSASDPPMSPAPPPFRASGCRKGAALVPPPPAARQRRLGHDGLFTYALMNVNTGVANNLLVRPASAPPVAVGVTVSSRRATAIRPRTAYLHMHVRM